LDATKKAALRFQHTTTTAAAAANNNQQSSSVSSTSISKRRKGFTNISLVEGDWIGTYALWAVCIYKLQTIRQELLLLSNPTTTNTTTTSTTDNPDTTAVSNNNNNKNDPSAAATVEDTGGGTTTTPRERSRPGTSPTATTTTSPPPTKATITTPKSTTRTKTTVTSSRMTPVARRTTAMTTKSTNRTPSSSTLSSSSSSSSSSRQRHQRRINNNVSSSEGKEEEDDDEKELDSYNTIVNAILSYIQQLHINESIIYNNGILSNGRCGAVQAILWLRQQLQDPTIGTGTMVQLVTKIIHIGRVTATQKKLQPFNNTNNNTEDVPNDQLDDTTTTSATTTTTTPFRTKAQPLPSQLLFWICDTQGTHQTYLGAGRGVIGILYTLLGVSRNDWNIIEQQEGYGSAQQDIHYTIHECFLYHTNKKNSPSKASSSSPSKITTTTTIPSTQVMVGTEARDDRIPPQRPPSSPSQSPLCHRFLDPATGNLRRYLDGPVLAVADREEGTTTSSSQSSTCLDWYQGLSGLVLLLLQAARVYQSRVYVQEAHAICDTILFPHGLYGSSSWCHFNLNTTTTTTTTMNIGGAGSDGSSSNRNNTPINNNHNNSSYMGPRLRSTSKQQQQQQQKYPRQTIPSSSSTTTATTSPSLCTKRSGPVGMTATALCFFQLSQLCTDHPMSATTSNGEALEEGSSSHIMASLSSLWRDRSILFAQRAHTEWIEYLETVPIGITPGWNPFSLYEGMGGLVSVMWQLASSCSSSDEVDALVVTTALADESKKSIPPPQMPLYCGGATSTVSRSFFHSIFLSEKDVTVLVPPDVTPVPDSPPPIKRTNTVIHPNPTTRTTIPSPPNWSLNTNKPSRTVHDDRRLMEERKRVVQNQLDESRRKRAVLDMAVAKRTAQLEAIQRQRQLEAEERKAQAREKRRVELDARKHAILMARKRAEKREIEDQKRRAEGVAQTKKEHEAKKKALLLARALAMERVQLRRTEQEEEIRKKEEADAQRRATELRAKQLAAEEDARKRRSMMEILLKRKAHEFEIAKQRESDNQRKEEEDRNRRMVELKWKEQERKRKEEARNRKLEAIEGRRGEEEARKRREEEILQQRKKEETIKRRKQREATMERQKKALARQQKEAEELRLKQELRNQKELMTKLLEAEAKHKHDEEVRNRRETMEIEMIIRIQDSLEIEIEEEEFRKALHDTGDENDGNQKSIPSPEHGQPLPSAGERTMVVQPPTLPRPSDAYSPSVLQKKEMNPLHYSVPTKESLFWSLQTETNIGNSDHYKPAMVPATDTRDLELEEAAAIGDEEMYCMSSEHSNIPPWADSVESHEGKSCRASISPTAITTNSEVKPIPRMGNSEDPEAGSSPSAHTNILGTLTGPDTNITIDDKEKVQTEGAFLVVDHEVESGPSPDKGDSVSSVVNAVVPLSCSENKSVLTPETISNDSHNELDPPIRICDEAEVGGYTSLDYAIDASLMDPGTQIGNSESIEIDSCEDNNINIGDESSSDFGEDIHIAIGDDDGNSENDLPRKVSDNALVDPNDEPTLMSSSAREEITPVDESGHFTNTKSELDSEDKFGIMSSDALVVDDELHSDGTTRVGMKITDFLQIPPNISDKFGLFNPSTASNLFRRKGMKPAEQQHVPQELDGSTTKQTPQRPADYYNPSKDHCD
jgi:hypothetical protein